MEQQLNSGITQITREIPASFEDITLRCRGRTAEIQRIFPLLAESAFNRMHYRMTSTLEKAFTNTLSVHAFHYMRILEKTKEINPLLYASFQNNRINRDIFTLEYQNRWHTDFKDFTQFRIPVHALFFGKKYLYKKIWKSGLPFVHSCIERNIVTFSQFITDIMEGAYRLLRSVLESNYKEIQTALEKEKRSLASDMRKEAIGESADNE